MSGPILGIDIGGTKLAVGVATPDGRLLSDMRRPSDAADGPDAMIERVLDMSRAAVNDAGLTLDEVDAIGIGCGGPLDPWSGVILNALNNPGWVNVPLVARIEEGLGCPAHLDNDGNAAALGEHRFGAGRGVAHMVYLTISTGVGGGLILDHRLYHGANGNAGELGHISVRVSGGRPCHCGSIGCIEAYCSGTNIASRFREALAGGATSAIQRDPVDITAEDVANAARDGDPLASTIWAESMELLGGGIVSIIHAFNPQRVVLGGGVTGAGDLLFEPVRRVVSERAMPWLAEPVRIVPAELGEMAGVLGAVAVALERIGGNDVKGEREAMRSG
ncbi:MAG TPA: ROK family protein [Candidatus Limnocylindria bacterium]|nr:ROK family protein [Candidatus Limnocylindria bacterium]